MWDMDAQNMAVNVIAKVESSGAWDAINYSDPITVGLMQWYGTRAAALLDRIRTEGVGWVATGDLATLDGQLDSQPLTSRWWTTRYLSGAEGKALKPILRANHAAQSATINDDIDDYRAAAERIGMDPDTNTNAVIFFCIMYHQGPVAAIAVVRAAGPASSMNRLFAASMNSKVFDDYRTRYTQARDIIASGVAPTMIDLNDDDAPGGDGGGGNNLAPEDEVEDDPTTQLRSLVKHITRVGDQLQIHLRDNTKMWAVPTVSDRYLLSDTQAGRGEAVPNEPEDTGVPKPPPFTGDLSEAQQTLLDYADSVLGEWVYTNDSRRVNADANKAGDCSAFVRECYKRVGVSLGLLTSSQYTQGKRIYSGSPANLNISDLQVGDLVYMHWANPRWNSGKVTDHVEMMYSVAGQGVNVGHPGPGRGPRKWTTTSAYTYFQGADRIWVQRHLS